MPEPIADRVNDVLEQVTRWSRKDQATLAAEILFSIYDEQDQWVGRFTEDNMEKRNDRLMDMASEAGGIAEELAALISR